MVRSHIYLVWWNISVTYYLFLIFIWRGVQLIEWSVNFLSVVNQEKRKILTLGFTCSVELCIDKWWCMRREHVLHWSPFRFETFFGISRGLTWASTAFFLMWSRHGRLGALQKFFRWRDRKYDRNRTVRALVKKYNIYGPSCAFQMDLVFCWAVQNLKQDVCTQ